MNGHFVSWFLDLDPLVSDLFLYCLSAFVSCYLFEASLFCFQLFLCCFRTECVLILGLLRRHMEKKEQKERGFAGVGGDVGGVGMGRRQEIGVVEDEGMDEKCFGRDGEEVAQDQFEKDVKVVERSVRSMEL